MRLVLSLDLKCYFCASGKRLKNFSKIFVGVDWLTVDGGDEIVGLQASFRGGASGIDILYADAVAVFLAAVADHSQIAWLGSRLARQMRRASAWAAHEPDLYLEAASYRKSQSRHDSGETWQRPPVVYSNRCGQRGSIAPGFGLLYECCCGSVTRQAIRSICEFMGANEDKSVIFRAATAAELPESLELLFGGLPEELATAQIKMAIEEMEKSQGEGQILLVGRRGDRLVAAIWAQIRGGRVASLWPRD